MKINKGYKLKALDSDTVDLGTGPLTFEVAWYGALVNQETKKPETKRNDISRLKGHGEAAHGCLVASTPGPLTFVFPWRAWFAMTTWGRTDLLGMGSPQSHHDFNPQEFLLWSMHSSETS